MKILSNISQGAILDPKWRTSKTHIPHRLNYRYETWHKIVLSRLV